MASALVFAGAFAGLAAPAHAQGFNGVATLQTNASVNAAKTDITVFGQEAIINWDATGATAADTNVDFLPVVGSVLFHDVAGSSSGSFTVLNRITPTYTNAATGVTTNLAATISLSGTVSSTVSVQNPATGAFSNVQGGNVWFYSPYGIITNGSSAFNVGSLLLTTSDIDTSNSGSLYLASPGGKKIGFLPAAHANSFVRMLSGTQVSATGDPTVANSAYVGVFAPRIEQGGTISSDGMTALVAGEAGTITFNLGLIDVAVTTGTTDPNGIVHTGSTGGPASTGEAQTVALVAMPQNAALTMLLSGSIGYTPALSVATDGSAVVLNAGYDPALPAATLASGLGNIQIDNTVFSNALTAKATGTIDVSSALAGLTRFRATSDLAAGKLITLTANAGQTIQADGALYLDSLLPNQAADISLTVTAGVAPIASGAITVGDLLSISANAFSAFGPVTASTGASNVGGNVTISVAKGTLSVTNGLMVNADAGGESAFDFGGSGSGGTIAINVTNKGTIGAGSFFASANGYGGNGNGSNAAPTVGVGGDGHGGKIEIYDGATAIGFGTLALGSPNISAQGFGSSGASVSGSGFGGTVGIGIGGAQTWGTLTVDASAYNGGLQQTTTDLGNATAQPAATAAVLSGIYMAIHDGGSLTLTSATLTNNAYVTGGSAVAHTGQAGGVLVQALNNGSLTVTNDLNLHADAAPPPDGSFGNVIVAPTMTGGVAELVADTSGIITVGQVAVTANATGYGASGTGADAKGGFANLIAQNGGSISLTAAAVDTVMAEGYGAVGPARGSATGGTATVLASGGTITDAGTATLLVSGSALSGGVAYQGSQAGQGFDATGNQAAVFVGTGASSRIAINTIDVRAQGNATVEVVPDSRFGPRSFTGADIVPISGDGGAGKGGLAEFLVSDGVLQASALSAWANGTGGTSGFNGPTLPAFVSGNGTGGQALFIQSGGAINAGTITMNAIGHGGGFDGIDINSGVLPVAGTGVGSTAVVRMVGGTTVLTGALVLDSGGIGGIGSGTTDATITGGNGGAALGGGSVLQMFPGSTELLTAPSVTLLSGAQGGAGGTSGNVSISGTSGDGGAATAGGALIQVTDGGFAVSGILSALAPATGGAGNTGGNAVAGTATFLLSDTAAVSPNGRSAGGLVLSATPTGGAGASAATNGTTTAGNIIFTVKAASATTALNINGDFTATAPGAIAPAGDGFTGALGAIPVTITGNTLITTPRDVTMTLATGGGLNIGGTLTINGRTVASGGGGALSATGAVVVSAATAINLARLASGATTLLVAQDPLTSAFGPIHVGALASAGIVTVQSSAFDATSPSALSFANSFATAGNFSVTSAGNLAVANITATGGSVTLVSTGGTFANSGTVSGTGVTIGAQGNALLSGPVTSAAALAITSGAGVISSTSTVSATGNTAINGNGGITLPSLVSGGTTLLQAANGAISITSLTSTGLITLLGQSATIGATTPLSFTSATTTGGDLIVTSTGNLLFATADATGAITLTSTAGSVQSTGLVQSTGNAAISGNSGVTLAALTVGGTTNLQGNTGAVGVTDLSSVGGVTASGTAITLGSTSAQPLLLTSATATAGAIAVTTAANLTVGTASATGTVGLTSTGGTVRNTGTVSGSAITLGAGGNVLIDGTLTTPGALSANATGAVIASVPVSVGGNVSIIGGTGITLPSLVSGGTTLLQAATGTILVSSLTSPGLVTLSGQSASVTSAGALSVASATTTAGPLSIQTAGNLALTTASANGALTLTSTGGTVQSTGLLSATGNTAINGNAGITLPSLVSGGTTLLQAANGAISITSLTSTGLITLLGQSATIGATTPLSFTSATTTGGDLVVTSTGNLLFATADATGAITLTSTGGSVQSTGLVQSTGNAAINGNTGVTLAALTVGGTTNLQGNTGAVGVTDLSSVGGVTASGTAITLSSTSAQPLLLTSAAATAGAIAVTTAANLTVGTASATGTVGLTSTGGTVRNTGTVSGSAITLGAGGNVLIDGTLTTPGALSANATGAVTASVPVSVGGNVSIIGGTGITLPSLVSGGTTLLQAANGTILVSSLTSPGLVTLSGQSASVTSPGALAVASATTTAGSLTIQTAGNLALTTASAGGALTLTSTGGTIQSAGSLSATGNTSLNGLTGITLAALSSGGTTQLQATNGAISVNSLTSTGLVDALGQAITIGSPGALQFTFANATAGDLNVSTGGNLDFSAASATGAFNAASGGTFGLSGGVIAGTITVTSADIRLGATSQLGARGRTTSIVLTNPTSAGTFIGGPAQSGAWSLDAAEAARLFADQSIQIGVSPPAGGAAADVVIGTLSLSYGPAAASGAVFNLGNGGTLGVTTPGRIAVTGAVTLGSSAANDTFSLTGATIDIIGDTGSIAMLDANGGLSGTLNLAGGAIRAETAAAFAATAGGGTLDVISARLDQTDGIAKPGGYLQANAIAVNAGTSFFIQNTGTSTILQDRRGFTANSLAITTGSAATAIAINGVIVDPNGVLITGLNTQNSLFINGIVPTIGGAFAPLSTINGCVIGRDCSIPPVVLIPPGPIIDVLPVPPGLNTDALLNLPIIQFGAPPLLDSPPLIDEPVTGIGNDDLWQQQCSADTDCHG